MADVVLLFAGALLVLGGAVVTVAVARAGRRRRQVEARERPRRLRRELDDINDFIRRVAQVTADGELDHLEEDRENKGWDGSSSR